MDTRHLEAASQLAKTDLDSGDLEPLMRLVQCYEQRRILVLPALQILLQVNLGPGIEINHPFFVTLAEDNALTLVEIDIRPIEFDQFTDTHSGRGKQVNDGKVTDILAVVPQDFHIFVRDGLLDLFAGFHLVDAADRAFHAEILVLQPGEEGREDPSNVVNGDLAGFVLLLEDG